MFQPKSPEPIVDNSIVVIDNKVCYYQKRAKLEFVTEQLIFDSNGNTYKHISVYA